MCGITGAVGSVDQDVSHYNVKKNYVHEFQGHMNNILFLLTKITILQNISQIEIYLLLPHRAYISSQNEFPVTQIWLLFSQWCTTICLTFKRRPRSDTHWTGLLQQSVCWSDSWSDVSATVCITCSFSTCPRPAWLWSSVNSYAWNSVLAYLSTLSHLQAVFPGT